MSFQLLEDVHEEFLNDEVIHLVKGQVVHQYHGTTYGCINYQTETAVTVEPGKGPFIGVPNEKLMRLL